MKNLSGAIMLPREYVVVNEEEMTYVEGGVHVCHLSNDDCKNIVGLLATGAINVGAITTAITVSYELIVNSFPVVGQIAGIIGGVGIAAIAPFFVAALCDAVISGEGIDVDVKLTKGIVFDVCPD